MHVEVSIHRNAAEDLQDWLHGQYGEELEREALVRVYLDELREVLRKKLGVIPGAICEYDGQIMQCWWKYTNEMWVQY